MDKHQLDGDRVLVIREFLTPEECRSYVAQSEHAGYEDATINTSSGAVMAKQIRDNARLIVDNNQLADEWWQRAEPFLPQRIQGWRAVGFSAFRAVPFRQRFANGRRNLPATRRWRYPARSNP